jgi:hypothetical protein
MAENLVSTLADLKEEEALKIVKDRLNAGEEPLQILYDESFYGDNPELTELLLKSINRSKVTTGADFKPLRITPRSLRGINSPHLN